MSFLRWYDGAISPGLLHNPSCQMLQEIIFGNLVLDFDVPALSERHVVSFGFHERWTVVPVSGAVAVVIDSRSNLGSLYRFTHRWVALLFFGEVSIPIGPQENYSTLRQTHRDYPPNWSHHWCLVHYHSRLLPDYARKHRLAWDNYMSNKSVCKFNAGIAQWSSNAAG